MQKTKKVRSTGLFPRYGAAAALILAALVLISASAAFFLFTDTVRDEIAGETKADLSALRDAALFGVKTRMDDMTQTLAAAAGYVEADGGAPASGSVTAGLDSMSTDVLSFSYESPELLTTMSEYMGESRERLETKLSAGELIGVLINYPGFDWEYTLFAARGIYKGSVLSGVVCCTSNAANLFAAGDADFTDAVLLVTAEGYVVPANRSQHTWTEEHGYDLVGAAGLSERTAQTLRNGLAASETGILYADGDYLAYAPLGVNGWSIAMIFDKTSAALDNSISRSSVYGGIAVVLLAAAIAVLGILVYSGVRHARRIRTARYSALSDFTEKVFFEYDLSSRELIFTPNVRRVIPSLPGTSISLRDEKRSFRLIHPEDADSLRQLIAHAAEEPIEDFRLRIRIRNSQYETFSLHTELLPGSAGRTAAVMGELANLAGKENFGESLSSPANLDALTGMPNYNGVRLRMERLIAENQPGALLIVDLNNFAAVNDLHGKEEGDEMLRRISRTIAKNYRRDDVVGRTGGDEFTVYMIGAEEYGVVARKAEALLEKIEGLSKDIRVSASIGIAFSPYDGATYEELFKAANTAMTMVKKENAAAYRFFSSEDLRSQSGSEA